MNSPIPDSQAALEQLDRLVRNGEPKPCETVFARFPRILHDNEAVLELIYTEHVLRQELGKAIEPAVWYRRFPDWEQHLRELFQVDEFLSDEGSPKGPPTRHRGPDDTSIPGGDRTSPSVRRWGNYELLEELGRGGMGVVYRARQMGLGRIVAVKSVLSGDWASPEILSRFRTEAQAAARLHHPHIVQIFEVGTHDEFPYFSMEYVSGGNLSTLIRERPLNARQAAELMLDLARAVHYAHTQGIIHRDLKPANVLLAVKEHDRPTVAQSDPTSWDASNAPFPFLPKVTDFGLAKRMDANAEQTLPGSALGTPSYMAPEQVDTEVAQVGVACDVYALGAILYHILVGRPPFQAATVLETLHQVRHDDPISPHAIQPSVPRDLETICLKCLRKDPARRYPTAAALADDLRRFLHHEPIQARAISRWEQLIKWARRQPAVACLLSAIVVGTCGIAWQWSRAEQNRRQAQREAAAAIDARQAEHTERQRLQKLLYAHDVILAHHEQQMQNTARAVQLLEECPADLRRWEWHYVRHQCDESQWNFPRMDSPVQAVAYSPDGSSVAACTGIFGVNEKGEVRVWNTRSGKQTMQLDGHPHSVMAIRFSPDGARLATAGMSWHGVEPQGGVRIWDVVTGEPVVAIDDVNVLAIAYSPDGKLLATSENNHRVGIYDAETGANLRRLAGHTQSFFDLAFTPDGRYLATASRDRTCRIWEVASGKEITQVNLKGDVRRVAFTPDGRQLAVGTWSGDVAIFQFAEEQLVPLATFARPGPIEALQYAPDGKFLATAVINEGVVLWDPRNGQVSRVLRGHNGRPADLAFRQDGRSILTGGMDGGVRVWDLTKNDGPRQLDWNNRPIIAMAKFHPDGRHLLIASGFNYKHAANYTDRTAKLVNIDSEAVEREFAGHTDWLTALDVRPDGRKLVTASEDKTVRTWDMDSARLERTLSGHTKSVTRVSYLANGQCIASLGQDGTLRLWNASDGVQMQRWNPSETEATCLIDRPGHDSIVTADDQGWIRVWARGSEEPIASWRAMDNHSAINNLAFSADGSLLAAAHADSSISLWNAERQWKSPENNPIAVLHGHTERVLDVVFSPDGSRLASTSTDRTLKLWDTASFQEVLGLRVQFGLESTPLFSPDGQRLVLVELGLVTIFEVARGDPTVEGDSR